MRFMFLPVLIFIGSSFLSMACYDNSEKNVVASSEVQQESPEASTDDVQNNATIVSSSVQQDNPSKEENEPSQSISDLIISSRYLKASVKDAQKKVEAMFYEMENPSLKPVASDANTNSYEAYVKSKQLEVDKIKLHRKCYELTLKYDMLQKAYHDVQAKILYALSKVDEDNSDILQIAPVVQDTSDGAIQDKNTLIKIALSEDSSTAKNWLQLDQQLDELLDRILYIGGHVTNSNERFSPEEGRALREEKKVTVAFARDVLSAEYAVGDHISLSFHKKLEQYYFSIYPKKEVSAGAVDQAPPTTP